MPDDATATDAPLAHTPSSTDFEIMFAQGKATILTLMKEARIDEIIVRYSGCGDQGDIDEIEVSPLLPHSRSADTAPTRSLINKEAEKITDLLIGAHNSYYEDGDGGSGTVTINRNAGTVTYEHFNYYTASTQTSDLTL